MTSILIRDLLKISTRDGLLSVCVLLICSGFLLSSPCFGDKLLRDPTDERKNQMMTVFFIYILFKWISLFT